MKNKLNNTFSWRKIETKCVTLTCTQYIGYIVQVSISKLKLYVIENNCMNWISSEKLIRFKNANSVVKIQKFSFSAKQCFIYQTSMLVSRAFKYVEHLENFTIMISVWKIPKFWKYYNMNKEKERKIIIVWIKNCVNSELFERISF